MKIGAPRSIRPVSPARNAPDGGPNAPERGGRLAGTAMPLRRNACAIRRGRRSSPPNRDADASRDKDARIDERLRFSPAWRKRQIHFPFENKGRRPDSSLSTAVFRFTLTGDPPHPNARRKPGRLLRCEAEPPRNHGQGAGFGGRSASAGGSLFSRGA